MDKEDMINRIAEVRRKVSAAALQSGRTLDEITVIGVSKFFPAEQAMQAVSLGIRDLGENRVQEMVEKKVKLDEQGIFPRWHLIGNLQTNKVRSIIGNVSLIHSVSSLTLLDEIEKRSANAGVQTSILLEINIANEANKHGFEKENIERVVDYACKCRNINLCGLMSMAPIITRTEEDHSKPGESSAPFFQQMKMIFDDLQKKNGHPDHWKVLSMGMSQDYETAIRCGATHVRIGTAIFGKRDLHYI